MSSDPVSSLLSLVSARSAVSGGFTAGGAWAIGFPPPDRVKFFIAAKGECWLRIGDDAPLRLREGDVFLLTARRPFLVASDLAAPPLIAEEVFAGRDREIVDLAEGDDFLFLGGHVLFDDASAAELLEALPGTLHLPAGAAEAAPLRWLIGHLVQEHRNGAPGTDFATAHVAQLMFLQILRAYLAREDSLTSGRLRVLADPRLSPAIRLMHGEPGRNWRLEDLARAAAMSRTAFAVRFRAVAEVTPLAYLAQWRMRLAEQALRRSDQPLAAIARTLGYGSESAFSTAFKRLTGEAPRHYRARLRELSDAGPAALE